MVIDCDFEDKVILKPYSKPQSMNDVEMGNDIHCAACNERWGATALIEDVELMSLKVISFVLEFSTLTRQGCATFKQWKDVPFEVPDATVAELYPFGILDEIGPIDL